MGNQVCCQQQIGPGFLPKSINTNAFQSDSKQFVPKAPAKTSNYSLPNEYQQRQTCSRPVLAGIVKSAIGGVTPESYADSKTERGVADANWYQLKRSGSIYQGQWKNSLPHGVGILCFPKGSVYIGGFVWGVPFGRGKLVMENGAIYEGDIRYGKANGVGRLLNGGYIYQGGFKDDLKHGEGQEKEEDGYTFLGTFERGEKKRGTYTYMGCQYVGEFENDQFHGVGKLSNKDGTSYSGSFRNGKFHGEGVFLWPDGSKYTGGYANGNREGPGEYFNAANSSYSKGSWSNGVLRGEWVYQSKRGQVYRCRDGGEILDRIDFA